MTRLYSEVRPEDERVIFGSPQLKSGITDVEWAYAAGFFDGEGSISIHIAHPKNRPNPRYHVNLSVSQCSLPVQEWLRDTFGGTLSLELRANPRHKDIYKWDMRQSDAVQFITGILPYMRVKKAQALVLLDFYSGIHAGNTKSLSPEEHQRRHYLAARLKELNRRGKVD